MKRLLRTAWWSARTDPAIPLIVLVATLANATESSIEWPRWRGVDGSGMVMNTPPVEKSGGAGLELVWSQPVGGGYSGVTVSGGKVFTMDRERENSDQAVTERVLCFDGETGDPVWTFSYSADYEGLEYGSGPRASVTIFDGLAYSFGANGDFHCLDAITGKVVWSKKMVGDLGGVRPKWGYAASPVIWKDTVIVNAGIPGDGGYVAFERRSGEEIWRGSSDPAGYSTPVFARDESEKDLMVLWTPLHVQVREPDTGDLVWEFPYEITYGVSIATPLVRDGLVFVSSYWHGTRALRLADGKLVWSDESLRGLMSCPLYLRGTGYLLERENGLVAFDFSTGKVRGNDGHQITPSDRNPQASIVRLQDTDQILALNSNGELIHATLSENGLVQEHWREQLTGKTWAHPAFDEIRVFARDDRRLVAAILPRAAE